MPGSDNRRRQYSIYAIAAIIASAIAMTISTKPERYSVLDELKIPGVGATGASVTPGSSNVDNKYQTNYECKEERCKYIAANSELKHYYARLKSPNSYEVAAADARVRAPIERSTIASSIPKLLTTPTNHAVSGAIAMPWPADSGPATIHGSWVPDSTSPGVNEFPYDRLGALKVDDARTSHYISDTKGSSTRSALTFSDGTTSRNEKSVVDDHNTESLLHDQREEILKLPMGDIIISTPEHMGVGEKNQVRVTIGYESLNAYVDSIEGDQRIQMKGRTKISTQIMVTIDGIGFNITPNSPAIQTLSAGIYSNWSWIIEARSEGNMNISVNVFVIFGRIGNDAPQYVESYQRTISVIATGPSILEKIDSIVRYCEEQPLISWLVSIIAFAIAAIFGINQWFKGLIISMRSRVDRIKKSKL